LHCAPGRTACPGASDQQDDADSDRRHDDYEDHDPQTVVAMGAAEQVEAPECNETAAHHERWLLP
jgi:hypothetical protein